MAFSDRLLKISISLAFLFIISGQASAWEVCDSVRNCLGNALTLTVNSGKGAHYVDVTTTISHKYFRDAFTFELWMKPERQAGRTQFVAGLWGPGTDKNDAWVIYFTPDDSLVFEINGAESNLKRTDNTIVTVSAARLFGSWNHIAAVFDGRNQSASLYINGILTGSSRNSLYPVSRLRDIVNKELNLQIGSCNGLSDNPNNRTFRGQMDEIRMWARPLQEPEILCQKDRALYGTEDSLMLYYRCNEPPDLFVLCDASGNGNFGRARSGTNCQKSDKPFRSTVIASPLAINDTLKCVNSKTYSFTVTDTSLCQNRIWLRVIDTTWKEVSYFTFNPQNMYLDPGKPVTFTATINADFVGTLKTYLQIIPYNWCRDIISIPLILTRITELSYSRNRLDMGTLLANCIEQPFTDSVIKICNNSQAIGTPRDLRIDNITTKMPAVFSLIHPQLPLTLKPGECMNLTVRFTSLDTSAVYFDSIKVYSNDKCEPFRTIPITGNVREVLGIYKDDGKTRLDSIDFGTECINFPSPAYNYVWSDLLDEKISIDSIIIPPNFLGRTFKYPVILEPKTGYMPNYFRFLPKVKGVFNDSIVFVVKAGGCTIRRVVHVKGKGFFADIGFIESSLDFGDVIVGQEKSLTVRAINRCEETLNVTFYLRAGETFFLTGARTLSIPPGETRSVDITFRPIDGVDYSDEICLFERRCFTSQCIQLKGRGIIERFSFDPTILKMENVIGCRSKLDSLYIKNISGSTLVLTNFQLDDPSGKFSLISPPSLPAQLSLNNNEFAKFVFLYTPNEVYNDRADRAFLRYETAGGEKWAAKLFATSISPKIFISDPTDFGIVEVGDRKRDTVIIENISGVDFKIDSIVVPDGFELIRPAKGDLGIILAPRDTLRVIVDFLPTAQRDYTQWIMIYSSEPCLMDASAQLIGKGIIVPLEVSISVISFGFIQPCDCVTRELPLLNQSQAFAMSIDSIWIDGANIPKAYPEFFTWTSYYSPQGSLPYQIPAWSRDTLYIKYCPRTTSERQNIDNSARLHIKAHGSAWENEYSTFLAGKRNLMFEPAPVLLTFPPTRVDTFSVPLYVKLKIPETGVNPDQLSVLIDNISFYPDERVFYSEDSLGRQLPLTLKAGDSINLKVLFRPRAVRTYTARMAIHTLLPCAGFDTTVFVTGTGFAPAFGLALNFDNARSEIDTFRVVNCDTLYIPVYSSREIPAEVVDIKCRLGYDTTLLRYAGAESPYLNDTCLKHAPSLTHSISSFGGSEFLMKNLCKVDSIRPFLIAKFIPLTRGPDTLNITLDSISFDTEEVILYHLIAEPDRGVIIILKPDFKVLDNPDFDSVKVLDCRQLTVRVLNTGDVPLSVDNLLNLPRDVRMISSQPPLGVLFNPGDTAILTLEFCPRRSEIIDSSIKVESQAPCSLFDSSRVRGIGYAPDFPFGIDVAANFNLPDTLRGSLGDTVQVPLEFEKDFSAVINGTSHWLKGLRFNALFNYNPRALKYLSHVSYIRDLKNTVYTHGSLSFDFENVDSLNAGKFLGINFLVTVPDSISTLMYADAVNFDTDSILFLNLIPRGEGSVFTTNGKCAINFLKYSNSKSLLRQNMPNPWNESTVIEFTTEEKSFVTLKLFSVEGRHIADLLDGSQSLPPGDYSVKLDREELESGMYYYVIQAGTFSDARPMILIK